MSSGCGDVLSLADLQTAKKHQIFEAEVITGKSGGVAGGTDIDYATNQVTGQVQKTMPAILRDIGFEPAGFDFTSGGTLNTTDRNKAVLWPTADGGDGDWYYWEGALPKVIPAASSPASTGGVAKGAWSNVGSVILRQELAAPGGLGFIGDIPKPITWRGFAGGAKGDSASNTEAITAANNSGLSYFVPEGYWPNTVDSTFNPYPSYRNYSGGFKLKRGLPGAGAENPYPLIWAEKTSKMKRVEGGTKWFDVAMQGTVTLEPEASAFGIGVSGYVRSSAGDVLTTGKSVDAIGVHGSGKAIGRNGRVWGGWFQAGSGDDGSGVRSSQLAGVEINLVNLLTSQPHPENLPTGEGPYRGLIITTADGGTTCGIGIDVGDGSGLAAGASGWWMGMRLRRNGVLPSGDWKNNYLEDTQQLKIEGSISNTSRYGGIRLGGRQDGQGKNFTYGINLLDASIQDANAINLAADHRIYWGPVLGTVKWIGYEDSTGAFNFRNMNIAINSTKVLGPRVTGIYAMTGTADGTSKNTETVTLPELARIVKKLLDAAIAHGFVGPT